MNVLIKTFFLLLFIANVCFAQDTVIQNKINYYNNKAEKYLDKQKVLQAYYSIDKEGIKVFALPKDKLNNKAEYTVSWDSIMLLNQSPKIKKEEKNGLSGYKIAIDAGHIASDLSTGKLEQKHLKFNIVNTDGKLDSIEIAEGMQTFATAKLLKEKLEAQGANVFMTRAFNGSTAFGITFDDWLKTHYNNAVDSLYKIGQITVEKKNWLLTKATKRDKFKLIFKDIELKKRAEIINNYKPDFTIIIHYNVDETNIGWAKPTSKDFNMTFVGGAFMKNDLSTPVKRFDFLMLLISDDLEKSMALSSEMVNSFEKILSVKTASINDAKYLHEGCLSTEEKGVFCRNLQLTRMIHSPLVYGETLYQDNINECELLNKEVDKTKNERVKQVSEAYYEGIMNYIKK